MKRIYLSAIALSIASFSFGQHAISQRKASENTKSKKDQTFQNNKAGAIVWSNDFSNIGDWTLSNASTPPQDWIYTTDINAIPALGTDTVEFTSGANGYLYIDSDNLGGSSSQNITATYANTIDLTGSPAVFLSWEQHYMAYQETFTIGVSNDNGTTWTDIVYDNGASHSPQIREYGRKRMNISAIAGDSSQVKIRFNYQGAFDWFWAIDDVQIEEADNNDLVLTDPYYGTAAFSYSRIPVSQVQPIDYDGLVKNEGAVDQTNTVLDVDINSGAFTAASTPVTIVAGTSDSIGTSWTPPTTVGTAYTATITVSSDSTDFSPANNTFTFPPFEVSQYIYAYDDFGTPGAGGGLDGTDAAFEAGNRFDMFTDESLSSIDVVIGAGTAAGTNIKGVIYEETAAGYTKIAETQFYQTTTAGIGSVQNLIFAPHVPLTTGKTYFAAVGTLTEFYYGTSGTSSDGTGSAARTSLIYYGTMDAPVSGKNYYTTQTPMVRMNFDPSLTIGVNESNNNVQFNVFPNPSKGIFNINLSSNEENIVNLSVKNVVGQTVLTETVNVAGNTKHQISLADYSKGIYFLTVGNETTKLIVE